MRIKKGLNGKCSGINLDFIYILDDKYLNSKGLRATVAMLVFLSGVREVLAREGIGDRIANQP
jgi:hypothetical protein